MKSLISMVLMTLLMGSFSAPFALASAPLETPTLGALTSRLLGIPSECRDAHLILKDVDLYEEMIINVAVPSATIESFGARLENKIGEILVAPSSRCRSFALSAYVARSIGLFSLFDKDGRPLDHHPYDFNSRHLSRYFLAVSALRSGKIQFITNNQQDILGTYSCSTNQIRIFPKQRPFNVAATLEHELAHFFIDKGVWQIQASQLDSRIADYVLIEEVIAALFAGQAQRNIADAFFRGHRSLDGVNDLKFFARNGPLVELTHLLDITLWEGTGLPPNAIFNYLTSALFNPYHLRNMGVRGSDFRSPRPFTENVSLHTRAGQLRDRLLNHVNSLYFGSSRSIETESLSTLFRDSGLDSSIRDINNPLDGTFMSPHRESDFEMLLRRFSHHGLSHERAVGRAEQLAEMTDVILQTTSELSSSRRRFCQAFNNPANSQSLGNYLSPTEATHRHGVDGARPGVDGARPSLNRSRMCIQIGDKF